MISRFLMLLLLIAFSALGETERTQSKASGNNLGKVMVEMHGSTSSAKETLYNPMFSDQLMSTLGTSWQCPKTGTGYITIEKCNQYCSETCVKNDFNIELQCNSETEAIAINPVNFTPGGEVQLQVGYDIDLDGTKDEVFTTLPISGFCSNGYVSCSPAGSWNNCRYFEFGIAHKCGNTTYDTLRECKDSCSGVCRPSDGYVKPVERSYLQMKHTGGCFCSNVSCGSSFNTAFNEALSYFGGGITSHLMSELDMAISNTDFDMATMSVKYMAVDPSSCKDNNENINELKSYYQTGDINYDNEFINQVSDSDSTYSLVMTHNNTPTETNECSIVNTPLFNTKNPDIIRVTAGASRSAGECVDYETATEFYVEDINKIEEFSLHEVVFDDWLKVEVNGHMVYVGPSGGDRLEMTEKWKGSFCNDNICYDWYEYVVYNGIETRNCDIGTSTSIYPKIDIMPYLINGANTVNVQTVSDNGSGFAYLVGKTKPEDEITIKRTDGCRIYENDTNCRIYEELINNDYKTYSNYTETGIIPQSICNEYSGGEGNYLICDYGDKFDILASPQSTSYTVSALNDGLERYKIQRTYICKSDDEYDFSDARSQADMIGSTLDRETGDFKYLDDGQAAFGNIYMETDSFDNCTYSCVVQTGNTNTEIFPDQTTRSDTNTPVIEERPCGIDKNTMTRNCPYDASTEILLKGCACTDQFSEVITTFGMLYEAVKDMICSQD